MHKILVMIHQRLWHISERTSCLVVWWKQMYDEYAGTQPEVENLFHTAR